MVALFLDDNKTNDDGDGKENGKKVIGFYEENTQMSSAGHKIPTFLFHP